MEGIHSKKVFPTNFLLQHNVNASTFLTLTFQPYHQSILLLQVYFSIDHTTAGDGIVSQLREQIHNGELSGTLKITDTGNQYNIRINI